VDQSSEPSCFISYASTKTLPCNFRLDSILNHAFQAAQGQRGRYGELRRPLRFGTARGKAEVVHQPSQSLVLDGIRGISEVDDQNVVSHGSPALLHLTIPMRAILFSLFSILGEDAEANNSTGITPGAGT
jgi:hypothetical protein